MFVEMPIMRIECLLIAYTTEILLLFSDCHKKNCAFLTGSPSVTLTALAHQKILHNRKSFGSFLAHFGTKKASKTGCILPS